MPVLLDSSRTFGPCVVGTNEQCDGSKKSGILAIVALLAIAITGSIYLHQRKQKDVRKFDCSIDEAFGENV